MTCMGQTKVIISSDLKFFKTVLLTGTRVHCTNLLHGCIQRERLLDFRMKHLSYPVRPSLGSSPLKVADNFALSLKFS